MGLEPLTSPCTYCGDPINADIYEAEMGMCFDCSNAYFDHNHDGCSWACMAAFNGRAR